MQATPRLPVYQIWPEGCTGPLKTWHRNHFFPLSEAVRVTPQQDSPSTSTIAEKPRPVTRSQSKPLTVDDEDSEDEEMGIDWLWLSHTPEVVITPLPHSTVTGSGTLRPEAREFVLRDGPSEDPEDPPHSLQGTDSEDSFSSIEAEIQDIEIQGAEVDEQEEEGGGDDISLPETPKPKEQGAKRIIHPPRRLTYDTLGECSEEVYFNSPTDLVEDNPWHIYTGHSRVSSKWTEQSPSL